MLEKWMPRVLQVTGGVTMLVVLQFVAPTVFLSANGMHVGDDTGLFFARHWGMVVFCVGALVVYVAKRPELRRPVLFAVTLEKLCLVVMVTMSWNNQALAGLHASAIFDAVCVLIYSAYLLGPVPKTESHDG